MPDPTLVSELVAKVIDAQEFTGKAELQNQIQYLSVLGGPITFLGLTVDHSKAPPSTHDGPVPGQVWVFDEHKRPLGTLLVWVENGYISALEYGWVTDETPLELPTVTQVHNQP